MIVVFALRGTTRAFAKEKDGALDAAQEEEEK